MHRFFRSFELCSLAVPTAPELSFVSALVTRQATKRCLQSAWSLHAVACVASWPWFR